MAGLSDFTKLLLWQSALQVPGMIMGAKGSGDSDAVSQEISQYNAQTGRLNALANYQAQGLQPYAQALGSIGSPLSHAQERANFAKQRSFLFDGPDGGPQWIKPKSGYMQSYMPEMPRFDSAKPFYSDEAMLASEMPYWQSMSALTGGKVAPGFQAAGYKSQPASMAQFALNQSLYRDAYEKAQRDAQVQGMLAPQQQALQQSLQPEKKKTPWWKKALGIAGTIGSMFIPGGGIVAGLARAGLGAASGALAGGKKGAILGGALGTVSSLPIPGIQNIPGIGSSANAKGMTGLKNLFTGNFMGTLPSTPMKGSTLAGGLQATVPNLPLMSYGIPGLDMFNPQALASRQWSASPAPSVTPGYAFPGIDEQGFGTKWKEQLIPKILQSTFTGPIGIGNMTSLPMLIRWILQSRPWMKPGTGTWTPTPGQSLDRR